jgi:hypothetical protein
MLSVGFTSRDGVVEWHIPAPQDPFDRLQRGIWVASSGNASVSRIGRLHTALAVRYRERCS